MRRGSGLGTQKSRRLLRLSCPLILVLALVGAGLLAGCQASGATTTTLAAAPTTIATVAEVTTTSSTAPTTSSTTTTTELTMTTELTTTTTELATTTTEATTTTTIPPDPKGWKRFAAGGISLVLPTTFKGGDPAGAAVKAQVKKIVNGSTWFSRMQGYFSDMDVTWLLAMFGNSSKTSWIPMVFATRTELGSESFAYFTTGWVEDSVTGYSSQLIEKTDTRAEYIITEPKSGTDPAGARLTVFIKSGGSVYIVEYSGTKLAFAQFEATYKQSAARIIVTPATGTTTGATTATTSTNTI